MRVRAETTVEDCDEAMLRSRLTAMASREQIKRLKYVAENKFTCKMRGSPGLLKCAPTIVITGQFQRVLGARHITVKYLIRPAFVHYLYWFIAVLFAISTLTAKPPVPFLMGRWLIIGVFFLLILFDYMQQKEVCQMKFDKYIREVE